MLLVGDGWSAREERKTQGAWLLLAAWEPRAAAPEEAVRQGPAVRTGRSIAGVRARPQTCRQLRRERPQGHKRGQLGGSDSGHGSQDEMPCSVQLPRKAGQWD